MCFSANVSFGATIVLGTIGAASVKQVRHPQQFFFAAIPLLFAVQQACEGFLWLGFRDPDYEFMRPFCIYVFLFFAQVLWPTWAPLSVMLMEKREKRKLVLEIFVVIGVLVSAYLAYCLASYPVDAFVEGKHIRYYQDYPLQFKKYGGVLYFIALIVPTFYSGVKNMWVLGLTVLLSFGATIIFYENYVVSVWCFFAALTGLVIFIIMSQIRMHSFKVHRRVDYRSN